jgi:FkbM family methyltransferase
MFRRLRKLSRLVREPLFVRGLRYGTAAAIEHRGILQSLKVNTVVDVGAHHGQFSLLARRLWPDARIHAFEPLTGDHYDRLFARDAKVRLYRCALGEVPGTVEMNVAGRDDSSSLLPISENQVRFAPGTQAVRRQPVKVERLDAVLPEIEPPALLKIDVQGYETWVIRGAPLDRFQYVYCEVSFLPLYDGQELAGDVIKLLSSFRVAAVNQVSFLGDQPAQTDMLFTR